MAKKKCNMTDESGATFIDVLRELAKIAKQQKFPDVLLADNLTTGALNGVQETKFVPVNVSKLLKYIADMME